MAKHYKAKRYKEKHFILFNRKKSVPKQIKFKKVNILLIIIRLFFIFIIGISTIYIINWKHDNKANTELTNHLSQYISIVNDDTQSSVSIDFDNLKKENNYFFAWLIVNGTNINYPVVHYTNNDYYLTHSFDNSNNKAGCPFADYRAKCDGTDKNLVIYAHNRQDR